MKNVRFFLLAGLVGAISGCATAPLVVKESVGPNPTIAASGEAEGKLTVYSATEEEHDVGNQTAYYQRTAYIIYNSNGREIENVNENNTSEFLALPRTVRLPPGAYQVKALAAVGFGERVVVPVMIEAGRNTELHLNGHWRPPSNAAKSDLVFAPEGFPVGWRVSSPN